MKLDKEFIDELESNEEILVTYLLTYLTGYDKTFIWKNEYSTTGDKECLTEELIGWSYGEPSQFETLEACKKYIKESGMKADYVGTRE